LGEDFGKLTYLTVLSDRTILQHSKSCTGDAIPLIAGAEALVLNVKVLVAYKAFKNQATTT
jgi:hypothetical protein